MKKPNKKLLALEASSIRALTFAAGAVNGAAAGLTGAAYQTCSAPNSNCAPCRGSSV
jgi:hypothetical protein